MSGKHLGLDQIGAMFDDRPVFLLKPIRLCAPESACADLLASAHGSDRSTFDELMREFLRQWGMPPTVWQVAPRLSCT